MVKAMVKNNFIPLSKRDNFVFLIAFQLYLIGFYLLLTSASRLETTGALVIMSIGGVTISKLTNKTKRPGYWLQEIEDNPLQHLSKEDNEDIMLNKNTSSH